MKSHKISVFLIEAIKGMPVTAPFASCSAPSPSHIATKNLALSSAEVNAKFFCAVFTVNSLDRVLNIRASSDTERYTCENPR